MNAPGGTILVAIAGLIIAGAGVMQIRKGWKEDFRKHLQTGGMRSEPKQWAVRAGKWGYIARGIVFSTIGLFIVSAAMRHDPSRARGIEGALDALPPNRTGNGSWRSSPQDSHAMARTALSKRGIVTFTYSDPATGSTARR